MDVADSNAFAEGDFSGVGLLFRAEDGEESGFARTVRTDEPDAVAVVDGAGDVVEQRYSAEAFGDILRDQDRRHTLSLRGSHLHRAWSTFSLSRRRSSLCVGSCVIGVQG